MNIYDVLLDKEIFKIDTENLFTLTSGIKSPMYCDTRPLVSYPEIVLFITKEFEKLSKDLDFDIIAGTATAGIPWASFLAFHLKKPMIYVRKEAKEHGTKSQIEGVLEKGKKVLLIEDLISTGGSSIKAKKAIEKEGGICNDVLAILTHSMKKSVEIFAKEKGNLRTIGTTRDFLKKLPKNEEKEVNDFLDSLN